MALINPDVSFKFINSKKTVIQTPGNGDILNCIYNIYGKDIAKSVVPFKQEIEGIIIEGAAGKADIARSNRTNEIFFVNERYIKNKTMSTALENAYQTIIPANKFPFAIVNIKLSPNLVDVNVHPTKIEVRFSDENLIYRAVYNTIKETVLKKDLIPDVAIKIEENTKSKRDSQNAFNNTFRRNDTVTAPSYKSFSSNNFFTTPKESTFNYINSIKEDIPNNNITVKERNTTLFSSENKDTEIKIKDYKIIGIAFLTYIIIQKFDDIYIIDQHAAHERVMYEKLLKKIKEGKISKQVLMIPEIINIKNNEWELIKDNIDLFDKTGFEIEEFGGGSVKISAVPVEMAGSSIKDVFLEVLDSLQRESGAKEEKTEYFIFTMACKAAVKANMNLNPLEVESLIDEMMKLENPFTCPHGRPTAIKMNKSELEKKFKR
jgi:DNA mismatch repair protein MutL